MYECDQRRRRSERRPTFNRSQQPKAQSRKPKPPPSRARPPASRARTATGLCQAKRHGGSRGQLLGLELPEDGTTQASLKMSIGLGIGLQALISMMRWMTMGTKRRGGMRNETYVDFFKIKPKSRIPALRRARRRGFGARGSRSPRGAGCGTTSPRPCRCSTGRT